jgi:DeoR/GlpR family transcriptional regulator of sugar metabolism
MIDTFYPEVRRQEVLKIVNREGQVTVAGLSHRFGVSEVTIRADLQHLADRSLIIRTHGGAVPVSRVPELSLNTRRQRQVTEKNRIGQAGADYVSNGEAIFLDTSSTALAIANHLNAARDLTVITNSLVIAQALVDNSSITVVMTGGTLQRDTLSLIGTENLKLLKRFNIQKGFFGAHGINNPEGLTDVSAAEAEVKKQMVSMCREVIAILDVTKWGRVGLVSFARLEDIDLIITDKCDQNAITDQVEALGIKINRV